MHKHLETTTPAETNRCVATILVPFVGAWFLIAVALLVAIGAPIISALIAAGVSFAVLGLLVSGAIAEGSNPSEPTRPKTYKIV